MTESQIIAGVRRGIREPSPRLIKDSDITDAITVAVGIVGLKIEEVDSSFFSRRSSLSSSTYVFAWPSRCSRIEAVWDMDDTAGDVTGATNASPIVITEATHDRSTGDIVTVHDVGGNTGANGTWPIVVVDASTYSLTGSVGNAAYTSGGKVFEEPNNLDAQRMKKIGVAEATGDNDRAWYPQGQYIVVDDRDFTDDLIIDWSKTPAELADIPDKYHFAVESYCIQHLVPVPDPETPGYADLLSVQQRYLRQWEYGLRRVEETMRPSSEPSFVREEW
jgi:hypothetical protein